MTLLMSILRRTRIACGAFVGAFVVSLVAPALAQADVVQCGDDICSTPFTVSIGGQTAGTGELNYDSETGDIVFGTATEWKSGDATFRVDRLSGNVDPILGFSLAASTGALGSSFAVTFDLPISIEGQIQARSSLSYALAGTTELGAKIEPLNHTVLEAWDFDTDGPGDKVKKGVNVGDKFKFTGIDSQTATYSASNMFLLGAGYDLMTVSLSFVLSPNSFVGLAGFVEQLVVPLPAALPLLLTGLIGFGAIARRRRSVAVAC